MYHQRFKTLEQRFLEKTYKTGNCWFWIGSNGEGRKDAGPGHGLLKVNHKAEKASRVAFRLYRGEIPEGMCVLHSCDIPQCVNPDHLFLGTLGDNVRDCVAKGRYGGKTAALLDCPKGHEYTEENTIRKKNGTKECWECSHLRWVKRWERKKGQRGGVLSPR